MLMAYRNNVLTTRCHFSVDYESTKKVVYQNYLRSPKVKNLFFFEICQMTYQIEGNFTENLTQFFSITQGQKSKIFNIGRIRYRRSLTFHFTSILIYRRWTFLVELNFDPCFISTLFILLIFFRNKIKSK